MPTLWDGDSPTLALIKHHYREYNLEKWDTARVRRLAKMLRCTLPELCALAAVFGNNRVNALCRKGEKKPWPPEIAKQFAEFERAAGELIFKTGLPPGPAEIQLAGILSKLTP